MSQKPTSDVKRHIRSYGRRKTKGLRSTRAGAMDDVLPRVQIELPAGDGATDPHSFFDSKADSHFSFSRSAGEGRDEGVAPQERRSGAADCVGHPHPRDFCGPKRSRSPAERERKKLVKQLWFEIGFGNGEHILHQALNNPDIGLIGCEPFMNGVAALCVGISEKKIKNIRIWPEDARLLMERLKPKSLDRLFLLHPDPWPKNRHHKRRFIQTETLDEIARLLKPGAEFRMATDHPELATWLLEKTYFHPAFTWSATSADNWRTPPADWPETRYGQKGVKQGRPPVYFRFRRK